MKPCILKILIIVSLPLFAQKKRPVYSKKIQYHVNPKDTTQRMLGSIDIQDSCGNEIMYCIYPYISWLPFEQQMAGTQKEEKTEYREYVYKAKCKPVIVKIFDQNKKLIETLLYKYSNDNTIEELKAIDGKENQLSRYEYNYDSMGRFIKEIRYDKKDIPDYITLYKYNQDTITKETRIDLGFKDTLIGHYTFNERKQLIVESWSDISGKNKDFEISIYNRSLKIRVFYLSPEGNAMENRMTYYKNGFQRTWQQVNTLTGEIVDYRLEEYEFFDF